MAFVIFFVVSFLIVVLCFLYCFLVQFNQISLTSNPPPPTSVHELFVASTVVVPPPNSEALTPDRLRPADLYSSACVWEDNRCLCANRTPLVAFLDQVVAGSQGGLFGESGPAVRSNAGSGRVSDCGAIRTRGLCGAATCDGGACLWVDEQCKVSILRCLLCAHAYVC